MEKKTCTKCGEEKLLSGFHKNRRTKDKHASQCKPCMLAYKIENKGKILKRIRMWQKNHPERERKRLRKTHIKARENLVDEYIKELLCQTGHLKHIDIPNDLIALKRAELKFKRYERKLKNEEKKKHESVGRKSRRCAG